MQTFPKTPNARVLSVSSTLWKHRVVRQGKCGTVQFYFGSKCVSNKSPDCKNHLAIISSQKT